VSIKSSPNTNLTFITNEALVTVVAVYINTSEVGDIVQNTES
jgi:hypothetical protein